MIRAVTVLVVLCSVAAQAQSQPTSAPPTPPSVASPNEAEARRVFKRGQAYYNHDDYPRAAEDFEAAYRLLPRPLFLYNAALAHRLARNDERALFFYRQYLHEDPNSKVKDEVVARIAELEKQVAANEASEAPLPPPGTTPAPVTRPTPVTPTTTPAAATVVTPPVGTAVATVAAPAAAATPVYKKWWLWTIVGGVVVVGVVVGVAVGVTSSGKGPSGPPAIHF